MPTMSPAEFSTPALVGGLVFFIIFTAGIFVDISILISVLRGKIDWKARHQRLLDRPWTPYDGLHLIVVMGTLFAVLILLGQIANQCGIVPSEEAEPFLLLAETLLMQGVALITLEYLRRRNQQSISASFLTEQQSSRRSLLHGVLFYVAIIPPVVISALLSNFILQTFNIPVESQDILKGFADANTPIWLRGYLVIIAIAGAPIMEEMVFRGIALPIAAKHASPVLAVIAVSMLFAIVHGHLPALIPLFVVAVGFSSAYIYSGSILVPMTMHALFNSVNLSIFFLCYKTLQP
jgi:membrane protease YdiL (CAAX protease family)